MGELPPEHYHQPTAIAQSNTTPQCTSNSTPPPSMLAGLPLELKIMIIKNLEAVNSAIETPLLLDSVDDICKWPRLTRKSRSDILNVRQVCRNLRDATWISFGRLVGDLCFRLSEPDLDDLAEISHIKELARYIHTITFGTAGFADIEPVLVATDDDVVSDEDDLHDYNGHSGYTPYLTDFSQFIKFMQRERNEAGLGRLQKYRSCYKKQLALFKSGAGVNQLTRILRDLPNLKNLRLFAKDEIGIVSSYELYPTSYPRYTQPTPGKHLRSWLTPDEWPLLARDWDEYVVAEIKNHPRYISSRFSNYFLERRKTDLHIYDTDRSKEVIPTVFAAWARSGKFLEDFRMAQASGGKNTSPPPAAMMLFQHLSGALANLHTLRLSTGPGLGFRADLSALSSILKRTLSLRDVYLEMERPWAEPLFNDDYYGYQLAVGRAMMNTKAAGLSLHRISLRSVMFGEQDLIELLQSHSQSLESVCFKDVAIRGGSWNGLLRRVTAGEYKNLQFFDLWTPAEVDNTNTYGSIDVTSIEKTVFDAATFCFEAKNGYAPKKTSLETVRYGRINDMYTGL